MKAPEPFARIVAALPYPPPDLEQFWDVWQRCAVKRPVGREMVQILMRAYPGFLTNRIFGGVAAIVSADYIRVFVPEAVLFTRRDSADPTAPLIAWLKSGAGYLDEPIPLKEITRTVKEEQAR